ncbi:MAG: AraC family transcriptional regulator [Acidobacteriaceae bacterium]|jgi:AraC family transcriptional regulator|nr:AraC family transcriptional regulator [Acidobacteriaceae bacterium]
MLAELPGPSMGSIQAQIQQDSRYQTLTSSSGLNWATVLAELRSYHRAEGSPHIAAPQAQISIALDGAGQGIAGHRIGGNWRTARPRSGLIWLKPTGGKYDEAYITSETVRVLNLYLATSVFTQLSGDFGLPTALDRSIRYEHGGQDEVLSQIGLSVLSEMMSPTAAGRMLVETASLLLAARLVHTHFDAGAVHLPNEPRHRLDDRRVRRVLDYVEEHLCDDIAVADLANIACLSIFHFTRAFSSTTGVPPHRYVSQRRLERAKAMIAVEGTSIAETAFACRFASQSSFTRAFRRATGMTPAEYRRTSTL